MPVMSGPYLRPRRKSKGVYLSYEPTTSYTYSELEFQQALGRFKRNVKQILQKRNNMKITKKFYVGSPTVVESSHTHKTLEAAISEAKRKCAEDEQDQIVVQIVRVVRVKKSPVVVERV